MVGRAVWGIPHEQVSHWAAYGTPPKGPGLICGVPAADSVSGSAGQSPLAETGAAAAVPELDDLYALQAIERWPSPTPDSASRLGKGLQATLRSRCRARRRDPCPPHEQPWSPGDQRQFRAGGQGPRAGQVPLSWGLGAYVLYSVLARWHPAAPGVARLTVLEINGTRPAAPCGTGRRKGATPSWCIRAACGSSVQVSEDRCRFST